MKCILCIGSTPVTEGRRLHSVNNAKCAYVLYVNEMLAFGNQPEPASIHIAKTYDEVVEDPDYVLSVGPKGGLRVGPNLRGTVMNVKSQTHANMEPQYFAHHAAAVMTGMLTCDKPDMLSNLLPIWDQGCAELYQQVAEIGVLLADIEDATWRMLEARGENFGGMFVYEASEVVGADFSRWLLERKPGEEWLMVELRKTLRGSILGCVESFFRGNLSQALVSECCAIGSRLVDGCWPDTCP